MTVDELNALDRAGFVAAIGHVFEHSGWVAEETWDHRPFDNVEQLHAKMCQTMRRASPARQLVLIRAHPDLAGRLARANQLTAESTREQASAGLNQLTPAEMAAMEKLNADYRAKFDFPFVICARLNAKDVILASMRSRLDNTLETEKAAALTEIEKIALLRLKDVVRG
jgi:2-oxo-4-hydroxy-4-carboxy-5-ureidoimidazoline decarboxylase